MLENGLEIDIPEELTRYLNINKHMNRYHIVLITPTRDYLHEIDAHALNLIHRKEGFYMFENEEEKMVAMYPVASTVIAKVERDIDKKADSDINRQKADFGKVTKKVEDVL